MTAASGLSPRQQLRAISEQAHRLQDEHAHYIIDHILPDLAKEQIVLLSWDKLTAAEQERLSRYYRQQVFPVLTPLAVDPAHPFPYISGGSLNLAVLVENPASGKSHFARVKVPGNLNRLVPVDDLMGRAETVLWTLHSCKHDAGLDCPAPRLWRSFHDGDRDG